MPHTHTEALRTHVQNLANTIGDSRNQRHAVLSAMWDRCFGALREAVRFPDIDSLANALRTLDALNRTIAQQHVRKSIHGIKQVRLAIAGIETFIEDVPLATPPRHTPLSTPTTRKRRSQTPVRPVRFSPTPREPLLAAA